MNNPLYIFDMDETLINTDCSMMWNQFLVEKNIVQDENFLKEDERLMGLYAEGKMDMETYLTFTMKPILDLSTQEVDRLVSECIEEKILPKLFPQAKALISTLKENGMPMLVISASVSFVVKPLAKAIGIDCVIGIDMKEEAQRYTSDVVGVASYREEKVTRLNQWLEEQEQTFSEIHFYTDSINDLPLCLQADIVRLVNPCAQLATYAEQKPSWTILNWG